MSNYEMLTFTSFDQVEAAINAYQKSINNVDIQIEKVFWGQVERVTPSQWIPTDEDDLGVPHITVMVFGGPEYYWFLFYVCRYTLRWKIMHMIPNNHSLPQDLLQIVDTKIEDIDFYLKEIDNCPTPPPPPTEGSLAHAMNTLQNLTEVEAEEIISELFPKKYEN